MKKSKMMRLASFMLVLTLLTTCMISGTFAKYVTSADADDSARVAKFGVTVTATGNMFATEYETDDPDVEALIAKSVVSTDKVVAPGTDGAFGGFTLAGTPEVAVNVAYDVVEFELGEKWVDESNAYYCPLEITVGSTTLKGMDYASADLFENAVIAAIEGCSDNYPVGTDLNSATVKVPVISWAWPFSTSADNDVKDTFLGDQAALDNAATISFEGKVTVTQID